MSYLKPIKLLKEQGVVVKSGDKGAGTIIELNADIMGGTKS